jgi:hypothetical protein
LGVASIIQNYFFQPDNNKIATTQVVNKAEQTAAAEFDCVADVAGESENG